MVLDISEDYHKTPRTILKTLTHEELIDEIEGLGYNLIKKGYGVFCIKCENPHFELTHGSKRVLYNLFFNHLKRHGRII